MSVVVAEATMRRQVLRCRERLRAVYSEGDDASDADRGKSAMDGAVPSLRRCADEGGFLAMSGQIIEARIVAAPSSATPTAEA
jgi:hypothetical protein